MTEFKNAFQDPSDDLLTSRVPTEEDIYDATCPICYRIMSKPSKTKCNHYYCMSCMKKLAIEFRKCPLCRKKILDSFRP